MTKYDDQDIKDQIVYLISLNPKITYTKMKETLAKRLHVSTNRINSKYQELKKDGLIKVNSISQLHGGTAGHELTITPTDFIKQLFEFDKRLTSYENSGVILPSFRTNKIMIRRKDGVYLVSKKCQSDLDYFVFILDELFTAISAYSLMKTTGFITKQVGGIMIKKLEKRTIHFIIQSIHQLLDQESMRHDKRRWNLLIYLRMNLRWLIKFENEQKYLFYDKKWYPDTKW